MRNQPNRCGSQGFSLVELVIAIGLAIFIFAAGFIGISSLFKGLGSAHLREKADLKLRNVAYIWKMYCATKLVHHIIVIGLKKR